MVSNVKVQVTCSVVEDITTQTDKDITNTVTHSKKMSARERGVNRGNIVMQVCVSAHAIDEKQQ